MNMPALDQRARIADAEFDPAESESGEDRGAVFAAAGADPGESDTWEIFRLRCPECDRPIALLGDEDRLPQHAVVRTAWNPFATSVCAGSGRPVEDGADVEDDPAFAPEPALVALLALPSELDWRMQPFSHVGGPGSRPVRARVPQMRAPLGLRPSTRHR
jgi:hypothetical protein